MEVGCLPAVPCFQAVELIPAPIYGLLRCPMMGLGHMQDTLSPLLSQSLADREQAGTYSANLLP